MILTHMDLTSFRSYVGQQFPLAAPRVLITGLNGSGKTSIREAIRWVLTGRCTLTDGKGAGAEILIPEGERRAEVLLDVQGIGPMVRMFTEKGGGSFSVPTWTGTSAVQQQALYAKLQTTPAFLDAVLDTRVFLDLTHVDAKALVLALLDVRVTVEERAFTLDELDIQYKQAFEDRKVAKRSLQGFHVPPLPPEAQMPTIEAIERQLGVLRNELGELRQSVGTVIGERQALTAELSTLAVAVLLPEDVSEELARTEQALAEAEAAIVPAVAAPPAPGDPNRAQFIRSQKTLLETHKPEQGCVLDRKVQCLTPQKQFQMAVHDLTKELDGLKTVPAPAAPESPLTTLRRSLAAMQRQQAGRAHALALQAERAARRVEIQKQLADLPETAIQEAAVLKLQERIGKGEQLLRDARMHWAMVENHNAAKAQQSALTAEVERLEELVELLGPKGARVKALSEAMGRFQDAVNPYIEPFGWKIGFSVEPWGVFANKRPVESYSKSEQYRIGIALQLGIAMLSGLKFAVIDELDMLDLGNRAIVSKMLLDCPLDQVIILGTREEAQALKPAKGVLMYRLGKKNGRTVVTEKTAA